MAELSNFQKWQEYTANLSSPQRYIDWGWYYTIAAALQRRVWIGAGHQKLFPNMYVILVGAPGIGKGLVIREVSDTLRYWKKEDKPTKSLDKMTPEQRQFAEDVRQKDLEDAQKREYQGKGGTAGSKGDIIKPLLIPIAADATTYEALVQAVAECYDRVNWVEIDKDGIPRDRIYGHSSLHFALQELGSLARQRTNDTFNYLLGLYDCPEDYEYLTKTKGKDRVRRGCLNLLAGTTPSFMQSTFDEKLVDEGFASRTFYIYAAKNRKNQMFIPPLTEEQLAHRVVLLEHVKMLTGLFGEVKIAPETQDWLQNWWDESEKNKHTRANTSLKLIPYYSRKNIHVMKLAMAMHFSESLEMTVPLETFKNAIAFLDTEERFMHLAITIEGSNPLAKLAKKIMELLGTGKKNFVDLYVEVNAFGNKKDIEEALNFLTETDQVLINSVSDEHTAQTVLFYSVKS